MENVKWTTAFQKVFHRIEQINHTTYNYSSFSRDIMGGVVNRNTIGNWMKGSTLPGHRKETYFIFETLTKKLSLYSEMPFIFILPNRITIPAGKHLQLLKCCVMR